MPAGRRSALEDLAAGPDHPAAFRWRCAFILHFVEQNRIVERCAVMGAPQYSHVAWCFLDMSERRLSPIRRRPEASTNSRRRYATPAAVTTIWSLTR